MIAGCQFQVGVDIVDTVDLPFSQDPDVFLGKPEGMCGNQPLVQDAQLVQLLDRGQSAMVFLAAPDFFLGFAQVDVEAETVVACELRGPQDHGLADGVDGVECDGKPGSIVPATGFLIQPDAFSQGPLLSRMT